MTEVSFYHLTTTTLEKALPGLLEKVLTSGKRAVLLAANDDRLKNIDDYLWTFSTNRVVPHGNYKEPYKEEQPVYLTLAEENPNQAEVLVVVDGQQPNFLPKFARVVDLFDGNNPEAITAARARFSAYKGQGFTLSYWKQNAKGGWEKE